MEGWKKGQSLHFDYLERIKFSCKERHLIRNLGSFWKRAGFEFEAVLKGSVWRNLRGVMSYIIGKLSLTRRACTLILYHVEPNLSCL